jgi:Alginate export
MQTVKDVLIEYLGEASRKVVQKLTLLALRRRKSLSRRFYAAGVVATIGLLVMAARVPGWSQSEAGECAHKYPDFPSENWRVDDGYLVHPACRTEYWDRIKFIPLRGENPDYFLSFGTYTRDRGDFYSHYNFSVTPPDDAYFLQRYYLHTDLHLSDKFRFFGELSSSLETGRNDGPRANIDEERMDVHEAFIDVKFLETGHNSFTLRTGRQEVALGDASLVATRDGRNIRRSFDGFRLMGDTGPWTLDFFAMRQTPADQGYFHSGIDNTTAFWGAYATRPVPILPGGHVDLYYMGLDIKSISYSTKVGTAREQRETFGARVWGKAGHWDYNQQYTFQSGWFGPGDIRAWAVATDTGYTFDSSFLRPRFDVKGEIYSGNHEYTGNNLGTFNSLYELGPHYSYAELWGKRNLIAVQPTVTLDLTKHLTLTPNVASFWRQSNQDGLYSVAAGAVIVPGQKSNAYYIGTQTAAQLKWTLSRHAYFFTEYLHFFPGQFMKQSTTGPNNNFVMEALDLRF